VKQVTTATVFKEFISVLYGVLKELQQRPYKRSGQLIFAGSLKTNDLAIELTKPFSSASTPFKTSMQ
jgi:hypothetical protein